MSTAIVTGGSRGIGKEIARSLIGHGWDVGIISFSQATLDAALVELREIGPKVEGIAADVSDPDQTRTACDSLVSALGVPALLVNNAGRADAEVPVWEADISEWKNVWETNMLGPVNMEMALVPLMIESGGGRIVNIVSGAGVRDSGVFTAYSSSKAALIRHTGDLHVSGGEVGIKSFAVSPGIIDTDLARSLKANAHIEQYPPLQPTLNIIEGIANGELDDWSGAYLRPTVDTVESLQKASITRGGNPLVRSLGILPYGSDDPC